MTFLSIAVLVLVALIILCLLFVFFQMFFALLPVALIAVLLLWLLYHFFRRKTAPAKPETFDGPQQTRTRKQARNVSTKDVDK